LDLTEVAAAGVIIGGLMLAGGAAILLESRIKRRRERAKFRRRLNEETRPGIMLDSAGSSPPLRRDRT